MAKLGSKALLMATATLTLAAPGHAATAPAGSAQAGAASTDAPASGGDIIVTAQKRAQRLIDVPQSVSVLSSKLLQETHSDRLDDYFTRVPSASINEAQAGQARIVLRGINTGSTATTVATYVDETPYGSATGLANGGTLTPDLDPTEIDRVEVLRGPQGTLYGANSLGGLVKYVTVAPTTDGVHASAQAGVESVAHGGTGESERASLNIPVSSDLAVRGSGFYRKDAGYLDDPNHGSNVNSDKSYGGRISALYHPTDALTLRGSALLENLDSDAPNTIDVDPATLQPTLGRYVQSHIVSQPSDIHYRVYNGTGSYDFGPVNLLATSSWGNLRQNEVTDATALLGTPSSITESVIQHRFTQEVRLAGKAPSWLDWTVGGYYTREHDTILQNLGLNDPTTGVAIPAASGLELVTLPTSYREIAGFANGTIHFGPKFDLTLGGRYSHIKQESAEFVSGALLPSASSFFGHSSDNVFTYSVAPSFKPNANLTIYARVAKGYRPGGPNVLPPLTPTSGPDAVPHQFGPDTTTNYEIGVKSDLFDHMLSLELTGFYIDWRKIQLLTTVNDFGVNVNGGKARSKGVEFSATLTPIKGLTLGANGAYVDAYLTEDVAGLGAVSGDHLPYTAKFSGTLSADYERPLTGKLNGTAGVSWRYTGHRESAFDTTYGQHRLGSFSQVDAHVGVTYDHFRLDAFVRNLTDSRGILDVGTAGSADNGAISAAIIRPRSFGATLGFSY
jgi:outer membrane receptor protein involved in Fe transport